MNTKTIALGIFLALTPVMATTTLIGCAPAQVQKTQETIDRHAILLEATTSYAVGSFIAKNPKSGPAVIKISDDVLLLLRSGDQISLDSLVDLVNSKIKWERLKPEQIPLIQAFIVALKTEIEHRIGDPTANIPAEYRADVVKFVVWVNQSAKTYDKIYNPEKKDG